MHRRFNLILITLLAYLLNIQAQDLNVLLRSPAGSDTLIVQANDLDAVFEQTLTEYRENGFWDAYVALSVDQSNPEILEANIVQGGAPLLRHVHFTGVSDKDARYLEKEFKMGQTGIGSKSIELGERRVMALGYHLEANPILSKGSGGEYHLTYKVQNHPELRVEGLASFNRNAAADTIAWFGQINVNIPNFDGNGKSVDFSWQRLKSNSEAFSIDFRYPWLMELPLSGLFHFGREVIDGNYQVLETNLGLEWDIDWERSLSFSFEKNESIITHEGSLLHPEWQADEKQFLGLGFRKSGLNSVTHRGFSLRTRLFQTPTSPRSSGSFRTGSCATAGFGVSSRPLAGPTR